MLRGKGDSNEQRLVKTEGRNGARGRMVGPKLRGARYSPSLRWPHQNPWDQTQTHPNTKKQINKKYINSLFIGSWAQVGGQGGTGPGSLKKRANSRKGLKIEHVSEATAGQTKWHLSDLGGCGGVSGHQNSDLKPVLEAPQGHQASTVLAPPGATHTAKKRN